MHRKTRINILLKNILKIYLCSFSWLEKINMNSSLQLIQHKVVTRLIKLLVPYERQVKYWMEILEENQTTWKSNSGISQPQETRHWRFYLWLTVLGLGNGNRIYKSFFLCYVNKLLGKLFLMSTTFNNPSLIIPTFGSQTAIYINLLGRLILYCCCLSANETFSQPHMWMI